MHVLRFWVLVGDTLVQRGLHSFLGEKNSKYDQMLVLSKFGELNTYLKIEVETVSFTSHCFVVAAMISIFTCSSLSASSSLLSSIVCDFINSASDVAMDTKEKIESKFEQKAGTITIERSSPALYGRWCSEYFRQIKFFQAQNWWSLLERCSSMLTWTLQLQCMYKTSFRMSVHDPLRWK